MPRPPVSSVVGILVLGGRNTRPKEGKARGMILEGVAPWVPMI